MVTIRVVVLVNEPDFPAIFRVAVPGAAVALAVKVSVLYELVAGFGLKVAVTPFGRLDADSCTLPLNPPCGMMATTLVPLAPCVIVTAVGVAARVKLGFSFGQLFTRLAALIVPIPVAKSQPVVVG
jgi:hypothetical protein